MLWIGLVLVIFALIATVPVTPSGLHFQLLNFYFMIGNTTQIFALPLTIVAVVLAVLAHGAATLVLAAAAMLLAFANLRNRMAGRRLLAAVGHPEIAIPLLAGLAPPAVGNARVRRIKNVSYGDAGERNLLDVIVPKDPPAGALPVLIHIHGGAWTFGGKDQQGKPLINHLVPNGWVAVDINYRLGPIHRFPAMIVDVLKAIAWVKAHIHEYGGDPARIAVTGGSAGGHLSALAALTHDDPAFKPGFEDADCRVQMALPMYGRYDFLDRHRTLKGNHKPIIEGYMAQKCMPGMPDACPELWHAVSPRDRIRSDAPPMLITHGTGDTLLPYEDARDFAEVLGEVSTAPVTYVELPAIQHAYDMASTALVWAHVRAVEWFLAPLARQAQAGERFDPGLGPERGLATG